MNCETVSSGPIALKTAIAERAASKTPLMLSMLAHEFSVTELEAARALPDAMRDLAPAGAFDFIWAELVTWENATFIMQHEGSVLEVKGTIPPGAYGHGYFNLHSEEGIGGHLKLDDLHAIGFLSMPFMSLESLSIHFFNAKGAVKFSVYAGREQRAILPAIRESFARLREAACKENFS